MKQTFEAKITGNSSAMPTSVLNSGALHLNREGNKLLQKDVVSFLRSNWFPNSMDVDHSLVSHTLPESGENGVHLGSSGLSKIMSNFLPAQRGFNMACFNIDKD